MESEHPSKGVKGAIHSRMGLQSAYGLLYGVHVIAALGSLGFITWVGAK